LRFPEDMENALKTTVLILKSSDFWAIQSN
jgi:hypothetical protein